MKPMVLQREGSADFKQGYADARQLTAFRGPHAHDVVKSVIEGRSHLYGIESGGDYRCGVMAACVDVAREEGWFGAVSASTTIEKPARPGRSPSWLVGNAESYATDALRLLSAAFDALNRGDMPNAISLATEAGVPSRMLAERVSELSVALREKAANEDQSQ